MLKRVIGSNYFGFLCYRYVDRKFTSVQFVIGKVRGQHRLFIKCNYNTPNESSIKVIH